VIGRQHPARVYVDHLPDTAFAHVLLHCYPDPSGLRFIQIGSNDGHRVDPLVPFVASCGWSGLMFEPVPRNFAALRQRHGSNPRLQLRQAAVDIVRGRRLIYDLDRDAHPSLPDWAHGLASFSRERLIQAAAELGLGETAIVTVEVPTVAWANVWRDFGPHRCDIMALDTEGHDLPLLRAAGLDLHRPRIVHFEHACCDIEERLAVYRELLALGYELSTDGPDTTAWLKA
jgi:FkbM family methyltransferase